ncbi:MAG: hypothetical protein AB7K24_32185, partial [Gemmataceae bacterium]
MKHPRMQLGTAICAVLLFSELAGGQDKPPVVELAPTEARPLDLSAYTIADNEPLADKGSELAGFAHVLGLADQLSVAAFRTAAKDFTFEQLTEAKKQRGQVVHVQGTVRQLRRFDKLDPVIQKQGVNAYFQCWMFDPQRFGLNPVCVVFTELPEGFRVGDTFEQASFDGYFFKMMEYQPQRYAPVLIGHAPVKTKPVPAVALQAAALTPDPWLNVTLMLGKGPEPILDAQPPPNFDTRMQPTLAAAQIVSTPDAFLGAALLVGSTADRILTFDAPKTATAPTKAVRLNLTDYSIIDKEPIAGAGSELEAYAYV